MIRRRMDDNHDAVGTAGLDGAPAHASLVGWLDLNDALNAPRGALTIAQTITNGRALVTARGMQVAFDPGRVRIAMTADSVTLVTGRPRHENFEHVAPDEIARRLADSSHSAPLTWLRGHYSVVIST